MADFTPAKDRFSIPDQTAIIRGGAEEGVKGSLDSVYHPEEIESEDFVSPKNRIPGGGEGGIDRFFSHSESTDPELQSLYKEFVEEKDLSMYLDADGKTLLSLVPRDMSEHKVKELFGLWLAGQGPKEEERVANAVVHEREKTPLENPGRVEVDKEGFHLGINRQRLARKASKKERGNIEDFWGNWAKVKNMDRSDIDALGFGIDRGKISTVIMKLKGGESITIPSYIFRSAFDGVKPHHDRVTGDVTGFVFKNLNGESGYIHPRTPQHKLDTVMSKIHMNGVGLPKNTRFFITPYEKESPIPVELPKVRAYTTS